VRALRMHGVVVQRLLAPVKVSVTAFTVDSIVHARRTFQGHNETTLHGRWLAPRTTTLAAASYVVPTAQALGALAVYLLEPESDDGLVTWNTLDGILRDGAEFPIVRVRVMPTVSRRAVP
jgi:hypothetical protein